MFIVSVQSELNRIKVKASKISEFAKNAFFFSSGEGESSCECMSLLSVTEPTFIQTLILKSRLPSSNSCVHEDLVISLLISLAAGLSGRAV